MLTTKDVIQIPVIVAKPERRQTLVEVNGQRYQVPVLPFERFTTGAITLWTNVMFPIRSRDELTDTVHHSVTQYSARSFQWPESTTEQ